MAAAARPIEERAKIEGGECLESYRVDTTSRAWPILVPGAIMTTIGAVLICTSFVARGVLMHRSEITYLGVVCMAFGPLLATLGMRHLLTHDDEYLAVLERGMLVHVLGAEDFVPWSDLTHVAWDAARGAGGAIVFERRDKDPLVVMRTFGRGSRGMTGDAVAARIDELRRKASFNLIH